MSYSSTRSATRGEKPNRSRRHRGGVLAAIAGVVGMLAVTLVGLLGIAAPASADDPNGPMLTDAYMLERSGSRWDMMYLEWSQAVDDQGRPADRYQFVSVFPPELQGNFTEEVVAEFPGDRLSVGYTNRGNQLTHIRALWNDGATAQTDVTDELPLNEGPANLVSDIQATTARVDFDTDTCTYGDYRLAKRNDLGRFSLVDEFNAPRNGVCYTDHGITLGVDTVPLEPGADYVVSFVSVDPATAEIAVVASPFTANTLVSVDYTAAEVGFVDLAASELGMTPEEFQSISTMLFAYLAAVGDGPASVVDVPDTSTSEEVIVSSFSEAEMGHLNNLAWAFGSLSHEETIKVSTLVLAYVTIV